MQEADERCAYRCPGLLQVVKERLNGRRKIGDLGRAGPLDLGVGDAVVLDLGRAYRVRTRWVEVRRIDLDRGVGLGDDNDVIGHASAPRAGDLRGQGDLALNNRVDDLRGAAVIGHKVIDVGDGCTVPGVDQRLRVGGRDVEDDLAVGRRRDGKFPVRRAGLKLHRARRRKAPAHHRGKPGQVRRRAVRVVDLDGVGPGRALRQIEIVLCEALGHVRKRSCW